MSRPIDHDRGMKMTTIYIDFEIYDLAIKSGINISAVCRKALADAVKHPGFKKKQIEKKRINDILKYVDPTFLKSMKKLIRKNKKTADHWKKILLEKHEIEIGIDDIIKWAFDEWGDD